MAAVDMYTHPVINHAKQEIRVVRFARACGDEAPEPEFINLSLEKHDLNSDKEYFALSYTWGPPEPVKHIKIDGQLFTVRENLWNFLLVARTKYPDTCFWIDQICIDQSNLLERNHQVGMMGDIYWNAELVVAWLGQSDYNSRKIMLAASLDGIPRMYYETMKFSQRPYWTRLWIIQELVLAREIRFLCGHDELDWQSMALSEMYNNWSWSQRFKDPIQEQRYLTIRRRDKVGNFPNDLSKNQSRPYVALNTAIHRFHSSGLWDCENALDSVYGLMGMIDPEERIEIDYAKSRKGLFWEVIYQEVPRIKSRIHVDGRQVLTELSKFNNLVLSLCRGLRLPWPQEFSVAQFWKEKLDQAGRHFITDPEGAMSFLNDQSRRNNWKIDEEE